MADKKILVVGDALIDRHWYCTPKGVSPEAPILAWDVDQIVDQPGGAANVVSNLSALARIYNKEDRVEVTFISVVPSDLLACLPVGFPTDGLVISPREPTVKNRILFKEPHQQIVRFDQDNNNPPDKRDQAEVVKRISLNRYDIGLISDYSHGGVDREVVKAVRASCGLVVCDPKGTDPHKYKGLIDILTPNLRELDELTSGNAPDTLIGRLMSLGGILGGHGREAVSIILKRGNEGCLLYRDGKELKYVGPFRNDRPAVDPTGAGDTFIAGLAFGLARKTELDTAIAEANKLAGISVTYPNCWVPTEEECLKRQRKNA